MLEILNKLIEILDSFEIEWEDLKSDILRELKRKPTVDNSYLWASIREIAKFIEEHVG